MERWEIEDFRNPSKEVLFELCMENLRVFDGNYKNLKDETNKEDHRDMLVRYGIQSYADLLLDHQIKWFDKKDRLSSGKEWSDHMRKNDPYKLKIARILRMLLVQEAARNKSLNVSFTDAFDEIDIDGISLIKPLTEVFKNEFKRSFLNVKLDTSEVKNVHVITDEATDKSDNHGESYKSDDYNLVFIPVKRTEITLDLIDKTINELEESIKKNQRKAGVQIKNMSIGELARRLSYLHRISDFLNENDHASIKEFPLSNDTCKFIYEYLDFWDLLVVKEKHDKKEGSKRANYIRSLIGNNADLSRKGVFKVDGGLRIIDPNLDLTINLFKKVKHGSISVEEFYERRTT